jgi:hypothetical protein
MVVAVIWVQKFGAVALGLAFVIGGVAFMRVGAAPMAALNRLNARLPGKVQYPAWYHRFFGGIILAFGLLVAILGGALAGR